MSKKTQNAVQPLSENTRRAIIITAIIVVAVIILSVALALILKPVPITPPANDPSSSGSSSLTIRNGDFFYTSSDDTAYPKTAQNWTKYGYKEATSSSHGFEEISTNEKVLMGIVTTATEGDGDTWADVQQDLDEDGITVANPGKHNSELEDDQVYMIAAKEPVAASILSDSFSVSSGKSVKITVWLNTKYISAESQAVVMLQKSTVSAEAENWYAYNFNVGHEGEDEQGWQSLVFHIFNRETSTKYIRLSVGLGNVYSGEKDGDVELGQKDENDKVQPVTGEGVLFVDDITYEEVTANDYRETVDSDDIQPNSFKVIENEDIGDESKYFEWKALDGTDFTSDNKFTESQQVADEMGGYSPFTNKDDFYKEDKGTETRTETGFTVYKLTHDGSVLTSPIGVRMSAEAADIGIYEGKNGGVNASYNMWQKDHHHISFWIRVKQDNMVAQANVYVQSYNTEEDKWEDIDSGSWTAQVGSQEIEKDSNCGWVKYDVYIKPDTNVKEISIMVSFGNSESYSDKDTEKSLFPSGTMYITSPSYERISSKDYNNASSGTYAKKLELKGETPSPTISNGSFSALNNTAQQPSSWTPAFAGDNILYRDGRGNEEITGIDRLAANVAGSQTLRYSDLAPTSTSGTNLDDVQRNILCVNNAASTSFGYFSNEITLSARTLYVLSVLVRTDGTAQPHFYLLNTDTTLERSERLIAEGKAVGENEQALGQSYLSSEYDGWTRQYITVLTGNESQTVRIALFNGSLDGKSLSQGSVYFDQVEMISLGTYATATDTENEDAEKYIVNWTMSSYKLNDEDITVKDFLTKEQVELLVNVGALTLEEDETAQNGTFSNILVASKFLPDEEAWNTLLKVPEPQEDDGNTDETTPETETEPVDLGLLFSVISSVALVAALLVVLVVKLFKNKKNQKKAA